MHSTLRRFLPLALVVAILLGACSPTVTLLTREPEATPTTDSPSTPPTATPAPAPTQAPDLGIRPEALQGVEVVAWHGWDGSSASLFAQMAAEFNLKNQWGLKVNVVSQRNLSLLTAAVDKSLRTPEHPDLVVALPEQLLVWKDALIDLAPYANHPEFGLELANIPAAFMQQSNVDNIQYGVPASRSARFLFYNVTWAKELGFAKPPTTWDEFSEQACAANASWKTDSDETNDGYGGLALDVAPNWQTPFSWLTALDGEVYPEGAFRFASPENQTAFETLSELRADGCAWLPGTVSNFEHLAARRALFITGNLGDLNDQRVAFTAANSTDQWTVLPFPGAAQVIAPYGPDYGVLKSSAARQLATWLFVHWMLSPENQARWAAETHFVPVNSAALELLKRERTSNPQWSAALEWTEQARPYPQSAGWRLASKVLADGFLAYFQSFPSASVERVLEEMDETVEELNK